VSLYGYLVRLETLLRSRQDIVVDRLWVEVATVLTLFTCELRFSDGSRLSVTEQLEPFGQRDFERTAYKMNYLDPDGKLIFRYDNSPHYPHLSTFPDHKHVGGRPGSAVFEAEPPDLSDVLAEIDAIVYPDSGTS
jgi:hypothetical protein